MAWALGRIEKSALAGTRTNGPYSAHYCNGFRKLGRYRQLRSIPLFLRLDFFPFRFRRVSSPIRHNEHARGRHLRKAIGPLLVVHRSAKSREYHGMEAAGRS